MTHSGLVGGVRVDSGLLDGVAQVVRLVLGLLTEQSNPIASTVITSTTIKLLSKNRTDCGSPREWHS